MDVRKNDDNEGNEEGMINKRIDNKMRRTRDEGETRSRQVRR